jgi:hypothetical protein
MKKLLPFLLVFISYSSLAQVNEPLKLYDIDTKIESRSISFENRTGEPGEGGKALQASGFTGMTRNIQVLNAHWENSWALPTPSQHHTNLQYIPLERVVP